MKDIFTRDITLFRTDVYKIATSSLKQLQKSLFEYMKSAFHDFKGKEDPRFDMVIDLERKQTIITKELQRRGVITKKNVADYHNWLYNSHKRRVY